MQILEGNCAGCGEAILHPLCPRCIEGQISHWLHLARPALLHQLKEISLCFQSTLGATVSCIKCKLPSLYCPYCYTTKIYWWLKHEEPALLEEYLTYFNFDLEQADNAL